MRLFIALDIDENIRERIAGFIDGLRQFAPDVLGAAGIASCYFEVHRRKS
jgi:hypothetical protein